MSRPITPNDLIQSALDDAGASEKDEQIIAAYLNACFKNGDARKAQAFDGIVDDQDSVEWNADTQRPPTVNTFSVIILKLRPRP
jgi:hypothetical protein